MSIRKKFTASSIIIRISAIVIAIVPIIYWPAFYEHFYVYLTGTVINGIVKAQWRLVIFFILFFVAFIIPLSYRQRTKWLNYGLVGAFFVSLFVEMYGIPLTLLFASKYLFVPGAVLPVNVLEFDFLGVGLGMDHAMVYGAGLMTIGLALIVFGWFSLYRQAKLGGFATSGLYKYSRHPQYAGFMLLIIGWWFGWPTILTLIFSPILIYKYWRAAKAEEADMLKSYGSTYQEYKERTPFLI